MSRVLDVLVDDLWIISIDRRGMDVRVRTDGSSLVRRISFTSTSSGSKTPRAPSSARSPTTICVAQNFNHDDERRDACLPL